MWRLSLVSRSSGPPPLEVLVIAETERTSVPRAYLQGLAVDALLESVFLPMVRQEPANKSTAYHTRPALAKKTKGTSCSNKITQKKHSDMHTGIKKPLDLENTRVWKPLEFGNHWNLETAGIGNHWNLETTKIWKPPEVGNHRIHYKKKMNLEITGL